MFASTLIASSLAFGTTALYSDTSKSIIPLVAYERTLSGDYVTQIESLKRLLENEERSLVNRVISQQEPIDPTVQAAFTNGLGSYITLGFSD